jgi:hypothetical protein
MRRRLLLLLLLYVTLDFANPLMPGAVRFESGSVQVVQADRTARAAASGMPALATLRTEQVLAHDGEASVRPVPVPVAPRSASRDVRRVEARQSDGPPSPAEDH